MIFYNPGGNPNARLNGQFNCKENSWLGLTWIPMTFLHGRLGKMGAKNNSPTSLCKWIWPRQAHQTQGTVRTVECLCL